MKLSRILPLLMIVVLILGAAASYIGWRFISPLDTPLTVRLVLWLGLAGLVMIIPVGFLARFFDWSRTRRDSAAHVAFVLLGFFFLLLSLSLGREIILAAILLANQVYLFFAGASFRFLSEGDLANNQSLNFLILSLTFLLGLYGLFAARHRLQIVRVDLAIPDLHPDLDGFRIAQISDIHIGPTLKGSFLERVVLMVNDLEAHCIAVTGDVVDGTVQDLRDHTIPLKDLRAPYGVFFCTGNHEYYAGVNAWIKEFRSLGLRVLLNEHTIIKHGRGRLVMAGVTDYSGGAFDPLHKSDPDRSLAGAPESHLKVLLAHQPRSAFGAARAGFDLQLSGHTHGGQIWPFHHLVKLQQPFRAGLHPVPSPALSGKAEQMMIFVNRGTGYWGPPLRVGSRPEITLLTLRTK